MLIEHDPLEDEGLELSVEFDGEIDDDEFGFDPPENEDDYDEYPEEIEDEEEDDDPFFQRDISSQPNKPEARQDPQAVFGDSKLMQDIMYYRTQGYTDEQILEGMANLRKSSAPSRDEAPPDFMSVGEEAAWYAQKAVKEQLENLMNPINEKLSRYEMQQQREQQQNIKANNGVAFSQVLQSYDFEPSKMRQQEYERLDAAMDNLYPGVDFSITPITPRMAEGIVRLAFGSSGRSRQQSRGRSEQPPPRIMGGGVSGGNRGRDNTRTFKVDGVPKSERIARMKQFLG